MINRSKRYQLLVWWLAGIFLISPAFAVNAKEQEIKVSFIYNFAKFIKWPVSASDGGSFKICVVGERPLSGNISLLQGRVVNDHAIEVRLIEKPELGECHILFIGDSEGQRLPDILQNMAKAPILSISDLPDFIHAGGIIGMKVKDDRVRFDINLKAAQKAGLDIDSQLLKLATEVLK